MEKKTQTHTRTHKDIFGLSPLPLHNHQNHNITTNKSCKIQTNTRTNRSTLGMGHTQKQKLQDLSLAGPLSAIVFNGLHRPKQYAPRGPIGNKKLGKK